MWIKIEGGGEERESDNVYRYFLKFLGLFNGMFGHFNLYLEFGLFLPKREKKITIPFPQ